MTAPLHLKIADKFAPWNTGVYRIETDGTVKEIMEENQPNDLLHLDITTFSSAMLGYLNISMIERYALSDLSDKIKLEWEKALPQMSALFYEHF